MKKLLYTIMFAITAALLSACLDDQEPSLALSIDDAFSSTKNLESTLVGAYASFQGRGLGGSNLTILGDLMADNVTWAGDNISYSEIHNRTLGANNVDAEAIWNTGYNVINTVNLIMEAIPGINDADIEANRDRMLGECYFLRGVAHFEMMRFYSEAWNTTADNSHLAIPILTSATLALDEMTFPARATVTEVYEQVIADLELAASLLPDISAAGRANAYVAEGYLMRVSLQRGDFDEVEIRSGTVLNGPYMLNSESSTFFTTEYSPESIFEVAITTETTPGGNDAISAYYNLNVRGQIRLSNDFAFASSLIVPLDQQMAIAGANATFHDTRITDLVIAPVFSNKYEQTTLDDNAPIMRLADVILARAEALAELNGVNQESVDLLNQIRLRSLRVTDATTGAPLDASVFVSYQVSDFATQEELIDVILLERQVELAFEGYRFHDMVRRGETVRGLEPGNDLLVLPIPQSELDVNDNLDQNDAYR